MDRQPSKQRGGSTIYGAETAFVGVVGPYTLTRALLTPATDAGAVEDLRRAEPEAG